MVTVMVFNATFNNISFISWRSVLLVEETTDIEQITDKLYHIMLYREHLAWAGFELITLEVIDTDCKYSCKSNYHTITTAPKKLLKMGDGENVMNNTYFFLVLRYENFVLHIRLLSSFYNSGRIHRKYKSRIVCCFLTEQSKSHENIFIQRHFQSKNPLLSFNVELLPFSDYLLYSTILNTTVNWCTYRLQYCFIFRNYMIQGLKTELQSFKGIVRFYLLHNTPIYYNKLWTSHRIYHVLDTTFCEKVCQWLATGRWFSPGTPVSPSNKTDCHDITEILLKVA
jgi:hypothetical protein